MPEWLSKYWQILATIVTLAATSATSIAVIRAELGSISKRLDALEAQARSSELTDRLHQVEIEITRLSLAPNVPDRFTGKDAQVMETKLTAMIRDLRSEIRQSSRIPVSGASRRVGAE